METDGSPQEELQGPAEVQLAAMLDMSMNKMPRLQSDADRRHNYITGSRESNRVYLARCHQKGKGS